MKRLLLLLIVSLANPSAYAGVFDGPELTSMADFKDGKFQFQSVKKSIYWYNVTMEGRGVIERAEKAWIPALLLMPEKATGKVPAMVLIHGIGGLYFRDGRKRGYFDYAEALAKNGVAVLVVDTHGGRGFGVMSNSASNAISVYTFVADAYAALDMLRTHPGINGERIGVIGFSKGGATSLLATDERFGKVLSKDGATFKLHIPIYTGCQVYPEHVRPTGAPVLLLIGENDRFTGTKLCFPVVKQMEQAGIPVKLVVYPGASHGWDNPDQTRIDGDVSTEDCQYVLKDEGGKVWAEGKPIVTTEEATAYLKRCTKPGVFYVGRNENAYQESLKTVVEAAKTTLGK